MVRIYRITGYSNGIVNYYEPTRKAANIKKRELVEYDSVEITILDIKATKEGISEAMNNIIYMLCANEH